MCTIIHATHHCGHPAARPALFVRCREHEAPEEAEARGQAEEVERRLPYDCAACGEGVGERGGGGGPGEWLEEHSPRRYGGCCVIL
jgi:hypothetical protein